MIEKLASSIPVRFSCRYFHVSRSSYYHWKNKDEPSTLITKDKVFKEIELIFNESKKTYGSPRVTRELRENVFILSENTIAKYMKELGLNARHRRPFKV